MAFAPWMGTVVIASANANVQLSALLAAIDVTIPTRLCRLRLELDEAATAATDVRIGNGPAGANNVLSDTMCGAHISNNAGGNRSVEINAFDQGIINTKDVWLRSDTVTTSINVIAVPVGA